MALRKSTPDRTPLQRLNDKRHSIALAGLAMGGAVAAVFRRKKRGGEAEFGEPLPAAPAAPESTPVAAEAAAPGGAAPAPPAEAPAPPSEPPAATTLSEPTTGELSAEEAQVLSVLAQSGRKDDDRTAVAVASSLDRDAADITSTLHKLDSDGIVSGEAQTPSGEKIWAVTERGVRRLGAQH
jgi:hypothetical protein